MALMSTARRGLNNILSNESVRNNAFMKPLIAKNDLGMNEARKGMKQSRADMKTVKKSRSGISDEITKNNKALSTLEGKRDTMSEADFLTKKAGHEAEIKRLEGKKEGFTTDYEGHQDAWMNSGIDAMSSIGKYFKASDVEDGRFFTAAARIGAAGGVYAGAAVGTRAINGGGATYNNRGERDIAGIPFI